MKGTRPEKCYEQCFTVSTRHQMIREKVPTESKKFFNNFIYLSQIFMISKRYFLIVREPEPLLAKRLVTGWTFDLFKISPPPYVEKLVGHHHLARPKPARSSD